MTKIGFLRRFFLLCFAPSTTPTTTTTTKRRLSSSLRDDLEEPLRPQHHNEQTQDQEDFNSSSSLSFFSADGSDRGATATKISQIPSRPSKSMVISTFFGHRNSHIWFCVQLDRLNTKPSLLLELSLSTHNLIKEMRSGLVRIALECNGSEVGQCPLHSVPIWTMCCNGRRVGFAARRYATEEIRLILMKMQSTTVGAGIIPSGSNMSSDSGDVMYMRACYEWVLGNADSESFHLISPDNCLGQELSVFLLRSR
ncbi:hypothetical protein Nepgr_028365 [Nepenthes gracilis]|uniref:Protein MIZU-KUSSEI 1-like n=1 Tax=Nepenthes gracilis TaxID=150966 RepID=A0AAD3TDJ7_NEPGR|nr:hypothetical protein Nepgr_028365 [Nepenthes gracilis]